jgi:hypothetical protein
MLICDGMVSEPSWKILPPLLLLTGAVVAPVTGPVAADKEFENALPAAPSTPAVFDFDETKTAKIATPTIAVAMVTTPVVSSFIVVP